MSVVVSNLQDSTEGIESLSQAAVNAAQAVLVREERVNGVEVSVALVDDERIRELNRDYRGKDQPTDVLSFPMDEDDMDEAGVPTLLLGDVVISIPTAARQALEYGWPLETEVARLTVHGTLHLLGYDHEVDEVEGERMRRREEEILQGLGIEL
ncbi:MAG: rRNA maturation RNase YbeY [Eubacteriales bacterium]|jgi:probable rRNA maturation factor|nr:rRNA maturation RNase YbeY [Bacillota bacterium]MBV1727167.1 rRNA maturation RNase YbeY [Desulforudis sp.]MDP3051780.1 rRNA maturation RNase YbeY [Eubacteriales bacterium]MBU4533793.1 rRNA maturation RNase YbeY [Bacillota bacterium]MBU4554009.1 rRNA maturation RNase YbeY [Bacillota bacterium]